MLIDLSEDDVMESNIVFVDSKDPNNEFILEDYANKFPGVLNLYMKNSDAQKLLNPWNVESSYVVGDTVDIKIHEKESIEDYEIFSGIVRSCNVDNTISVEVDSGDAVFRNVFSVSLENIRLVDSSRLCLNDNLVEFGIIYNLTQSFVDSDNALLRFSSMPN